LKNPESLLTPFLDNAMNARKRLCLPDIQASADGAWSVAAKTLESIHDHSAYALIDGRHG